MFQKKLDQIMAQEMTRKQFLVTIGLALVSLTGFSSFMGVLTPKDRRLDKPPVGYGLQNYGP